MKRVECQGGGQLVAVGAGDIDKKIDPDSDTARLAAHRKASSIWPNGRPETHDERRIRAAAALVFQALIDVDHIKDAKPNTAHAAHLLRQAWEILDPLQEALGPCGK